MNWKVQPVHLQGALIYCVVLSRQNRITLGAIILSDSSTHIRYLSKTCQQFHFLLPTKTYST